MFSMCSLLFHSNSVTKNEVKLQVALLKVHFPTSYLRNNFPQGNKSFLVSTEKELVHSCC